MKILNKTLTTFLAIALSVAALVAQTPEERGLEIAQEADLRDEGFVDIKSDLTMILRNRHGQESTRYMRNKTLEVVGDGDKFMVIFDSPRDVKGTASMTFTHKTGPDDQWLYLPAIKRVKRISSNNKSGPFMGSEFAFEDLSSQEVEKYTYKYLKEESLDGTKTYVIERYPVDKKSGYTRQIVWYNADNYRIEKAEYYDRKDALLKTLTYSKYEQYLDKFWRQGEMLMVNHQTGKETRLIFENYEFQTGLTERDFTQNSLKRAR